MGSAGLPQAPRNTFDDWCSGGVRFFTRCYMPFWTFQTIMSVLKTHYCRCHC